MHAGLYPDEQRLHILAEASDEPDSPPRGQEVHALPELQLPSYFCQDPRQVVVYSWMVEITDGGDDLRDRTTAVSLVCS